jgi:hypothetical protein
MRNSSGIVKWIVLIVVVIVVWKKGIPWFKQQGYLSSSMTSSAPAATTSSCPQRAAAASEAWGSRLSAFVNPPVDKAAWGDFRSSVEAKISSATDECRCPSESCAKAADAMNQLQSLVSTVDSAVQSGTPPPPDLAQSQERIDNTIDEAQSLAREGK